MFGSEATITPTIDANPMIHVALIIILFLIPCRSSHRLIRSNTMFISRSYLSRGICQNLHSIIWHTNQDSLRNSCPLDYTARGLCMSDIPISNPNISPHYYCSLAFHTWSSSYLLTFQTNRTEECVNYLVFVGHGCIFCKSVYEFMIFFPTFSRREFVEFRTSRYA
jgi:hypothetical protein